MTDSPLPLDTGVLIALAATTGSWEVLDVLRRPVIITATVMEEVRNGSPGSPGSNTALAGCMSVWEKRIEVPPYLRGVLDRGEASVIALALENHWPEVGIDESVGRSVAKTSGLRLTGSLGLLIRAKRAGCPVSVADSIFRIRDAGIWIGGNVERVALRAAGEEI